jgi:hypothetical protein
MGTLVELLEWVGRSLVVGYASDHQVREVKKKERRKRSKASSGKRDNNNNSPLHSLYHLDIHTDSPSAHSTPPRSTRSYAELVVLVLAPSFSSFIPRAFLPLSSLV